MKHERRIPAWLLRDLPARAGMFACFWLFVILLIAEGFRIIRGGKPSQDKFDGLADPLLAAEAALACALWREAYRRLGYNPKLVKLELADLPADNIELMAQVRSCMDQVQNLSRAASHYTEMLRRRSGVTAQAAHASTGTRRAATHEAVGVATASSRRPVLTLILSSDRRERPSKHEVGIACARGPSPLRYCLRLTPNLLSAAARLRTPMRAC